MEKNVIRKTMKMSIKKGNEGGQESMNNKTFKPGQAVFYKPKDLSGKVYKVEAGIVKRMSDDGTKAFVWYHSGCTAASTPLEYLEATELTAAHKDIHKGCSQCKS